MTRTLSFGLLLSLIACGDEKAHDHDDAPTDPAGDEADADTDADADVTALGGAPFLLLLLSRARRAGPGV